VDVCGRIKTGRPFESTDRAYFGGDDGNDDDDDFEDEEI
jgi:hypothetical protein